MPNSATTANAVYLRTAILGFAAGLRSQLPLALIAAAAGRGEFAKDATGRIALIRTRAARLGFGATAIGEFVLDKTPLVPSRINPGPFAGRVVFGGLTGAVFARGNGRSTPLGFALGAAGSGLGTIAGYRFRVTLDDKTGLPESVWAVTEDLVAFAVAHRALHG